MKKFLNILVIILFYFTNIALGIGDSLRVPVGVDKLRVQETIAPYSIKDIEELLGKFPKKPKDYYRWWKAINIERLALALNSDDNRLRQKAKEVLNKLEPKDKKEVEVLSTELKEAKKLLLPTPKHPHHEPSSAEIGQLGFGKAKALELMQECLEVIKRDAAFGKYVNITSEKIAIKDNRTRIFVNNPARWQITIEVKYKGKGKDIIASLEIIVGQGLNEIDTLSINSPEDIHSKLEGFLIGLKSSLVGEPTTPKPTANIIHTKAPEKPWQEQVESSSAIKKELEKILVEYEWKRGDDGTSMSLNFDNPFKDSERLVFKIMLIYSAAFSIEVLRYTHNNEAIVQIIPSCKNIQDVAKQLIFLITRSGYLKKWNSDLENNKKALDHYVKDITAHFLRPDESERYDVEVKWNKTREKVEVIFTKKSAQDKQLKIVVENNKDTRGTQVSACVLDETGQEIQLDLYQDVKIGDLPTCFNGIKRQNLVKAFLKTEMEDLVETLQKRIMNEPEIELFKKAEPTLIREEKISDNYILISIFNPLTEGIRLCIGIMYSSADSSVFLKSWKQIRKEIDRDSIGRFIIDNVGQADKIYAEYMENLRKKKIFMDWINILQKRQVKIKPNSDLTVQTAI